MPIDPRNWFRGSRDKPSQEEVYVDSASVPAEPEGPYRARLETAARERVVAGIDVSERETVTGELQVVYVTRCPCGNRWESSQAQRMSVCAKCNRAVLVEVPGIPPG
jgi:hypothetical protein